jgi:glycyl-tRNA synthetase beta chain
MDFFADRLKVALREQGVRHDLITAVFALGDEDDLTRLLARVDALKGFVESADGTNLLTAHKRAANIVRIEEKKDSARYNGNVDADALTVAEERELNTAMGIVSDAARKAVAREDFTGAMAAMAQLRPPVDAFFDKVTVNDKDPKLRANRLRMLSAINATLSTVADFSKIEG